MSYLYFHGQGVGQDALEALYWAELAPAGAIAPLSPPVTAWPPA